MYIALPMQVEEMYAPEINDFVYITDNAYSALEIRQMELRSFNFVYFKIFRSSIESLVSNGFAFLFKSRLLMNLHLDADGPNIMLIADPDLVSGSKINSETYSETDLGFN